MTTLPIIVLLVGLICWKREHFSNYAHFGLQEINGMFTLRFIHQPKMYFSLLPPIAESFLPSLPNAHRLLAPLCTSQALAHVYRSREEEISPFVIV